ncbi:MAG: SagB/ThcOx family dehydrogenase [Deltaproteobacteria bacterium]|nr:SagB/ThcOx family dehydrogenase [Deltaproteobacteria bacterium]
MNDQGIGDRYQEETRYDRSGMGGRGLDWASKPSPFKTYPDCIRRVPIPELSKEEEISLWNVLAERRSLRNFTLQSLDYPVLARLLWATQGVTRREGSSLLRTAPSAGALYPIETYIVINRVEDLSPGVYHLDIGGWNLELMREGSFGQPLAAAALHQDMLEAAATVLVWTAVVARSAWKYSHRAYRYLYMDAGHIGQNLYLAATALKLGCCTVGAFFDAEINDILGVDGKEEFAVYMGAVGRPG